MAFGKNPFVQRAQAAEQKAADAPDDAARARAYRDAAHQWDRAAERELPGRRRDEYARSADENRARADGEAGRDDDGRRPDEAPPDPKSLN